MVRGRDSSITSSLLALVIIIALGVGGTWWLSSIARKQGAEAYRQGMSESANPWEGYYYRKAWIDGYYAAKREIRR